MLQRRLFLTLSLLAGVTGFGGCKPRAADSALRATDDANKESTVSIEREVVTNLSVEDTDCQRRAGRFVEWAKYWASPSVTTDKVETPSAAHITAANQLAIKLHATAGAHIDWLKTARAAEAKARKSGSVSVAGDDVDVVIATYEGIQSVLQPLIAAEAWANWSAEFGQSASKRFSDVAAAFGLTVEEVGTWKPTDDDLAVDALDAAKANGPQSGNAAPPPPVGGKGEPESGTAQNPQTPAGKPTPKVTPKPPPPPQKSQQQLAYEAAEREKLNWLKFVQTAERRIVDGDFTGKMPSLEDMQRAIEESEGSQGRLCNDGLADGRSVCRGQAIIDALSRVEEIKGLYSDLAGVSEGYTVRQHTERVLAVYLEQRKRYGYPQSDKRYPLMMPIVVALHDIGKPVAARTSGTQAQHVHNKAIVGAMLRHLGFTAEEVQVGTTIVSGDLLGWVVKGNVDTQSAINSLADFAEQAGVSKKEYFAVLRTEYLADAASYPSVRQSAFYPDQTGKLVSRNGSLERLHLALNPPPTPPPTPKPVPKTPIKPIPTQQDVVKGEINAGDLGPAGEKAAMAVVDKANGTMTPEQQAAAGQTGQVQQAGAQQGGAQQGGAQQAQPEKQAAQPAQQQAAQPAHPQPWFVGKKFTSQRIENQRFVEVAYLFLANGVGHYYPARNTHPDWFVQAKWEPAGGQKITVTYNTENGGKSTFRLEVLSAKEMTWWAGGSGTSATTP